MIKKYAKEIIMTVAIISIVIYALGYRLTGDQAAKAYLKNTGIEQSSQYFVYEEKNAWGSIYLIDSTDKIETIISKRYGLLWKAEGAYKQFKMDKPIGTVGWVINPDCTFLAFEVIDEAVSYIEAGVASNSNREYVDENGLVIFSWDQSKTLEEINGIAYSVKGEKLYEFRYPISNEIYLNELGWYEPELQ